MKDQALVFGVLLGIIVILIIGGVSVSIKLNQVNKNYQLAVKKKIELEKKSQSLEAEKEALLKSNQELKRKIEELNKKIDDLNKEKENLLLELEKMKRLKEKLEENLKEELMKKE